MRSGGWFEGGLSVWAWTTAGTLIEIQSRVSGALHSCSQRRRSEGEEWQQ